MDVTFPRSRRHPRPPFRLRGVVVVPLVALATLCLGPVRAEAQDLGVQRVATSSGTFLKIGLDARGAALGGSYNALVEGAAAAFYNPAGIAVGPDDGDLFLSYVAWPADIRLGAVSVTRNVPQFGGRVAFALAFLGTDLDETTEFRPFGTGRTVSYSDVLGTLSFSRLFTDRLSIGVSAKLFYEYWVVFFTDFQVLSGFHEHKLIFAGHRVDRTSGHKHCRQ